VAAPLRRVPDQSTEQLRRRPKPASGRFLARWRADVRLRVAAWLVIGSGAVFATLHKSPRVEVDLSSPPVREALATWTDIAAGLVDTVPARLLLGADGRNQDLDATLLSKGVSRSAFKHAADVVVRSVGSFSDDASEEALAIGFSTIPLPEGIEIPSAVLPSRMIRTPTIETARALVLELSARLATSVSSPEDS